MRKEIKETKIFKEMLEDERNDWFYHTDKKNITMLDNVYYSVFLKGDLKKVHGKVAHISIENMMDTLMGIKEHCREEREKIEILENTFVQPFGIKNFPVCISLNDQFDIFFRTGIPNNNSNRIQVQIRSIALWLEGDHCMVDRSLKCLKKILDMFSTEESKIEIAKIQENRIDICNHINSIQQPKSFFHDKYIDKYCHSSARIMNRISVKECGKWIPSYLGFGVRGKAVFTRIYDKTREVVELGYKGIIFERWYITNLISRYDKWIYEFCYKTQSYAQIVIAKIEFYNEYGKDQAIKEQLNYLKDTYKDNLIELNGIVDKMKVVPRPTRIVNVEFELRRDYFRQCSRQIAKFKTIEDRPENRLNKILDNMGYFQEELTSRTLNFKDQRDYKSWWRRLRTSKMYTCSDLDIKQLRDYSRNLDMDKILKTTAKNIATINVYRNIQKDKYNPDTSLDRDYEDSKKFINDNYIEHLKLDYKDYKKRKIKDIKPFLNPKVDEDPSN